MELVSKDRNWSGHTRQMCERVLVRVAGVVEPLVHGQHGGLGDRPVRQGSARTQGQAMGILRYAEPVFLNVYGAQESIPRDEFRQPM
jgi:hypothetical protein